MNQNKKRLILIIGVIAAVVVVLCVIFFRRSPSSAQQAIDTTPVTRGTIRKMVRATATVTPENKLEIIPAVTGRAESVEVDMGAKVKQGQVLLWMSSTERAAMLDAAQAKGPKEIEFWKDVYKPTAVVAPLDGTIISRNVVPGQTVGTSTNVFVMSDRLIVEADLDETDLGKVAMDQSADITLDGFPDMRLHGKVYKIAYSSTTVNNVNTYKVDVLLDTIPEEMRSGMTANVSFLIAEHKDVLVIPAAAVQNNGGVFVVDPKSRELQQRTVTVGLNDGKSVEVLSGLAEGEIVANNSYKVLEAAANNGFSLLPKFPKNRGNGPPPH